MNDYCLTNDNFLKEDMILYRVTQGFTFLKAYLQFSHCTPVYSLGQEQRKPLEFSEHVPLFWHGALLQYTSDKIETREIRYTYIPD